jgi:hypothetical protein
LPTFVVTASWELAMFSRASDATRTKLALKRQAAEIGLWEINPVKWRPRKI